jgi:hypothetical protein
MFAAAADARRSDYRKMPRLAPARIVTRPARPGRPNRPPFHSVHRLAIYAAGIVVILAAVILRLAPRLERAGALGLAGIEAAVRLSRGLRRFGRRLLYG